MDITGKIIAVLEQRGGVSKSTGNEWKVGSYVLETIEQYPKRVCFEVFGTDRLQQFNIQMGETMTISVDIDAREYNGRWYNQIRAFRVNRDLNAATAAPQAPVPPFDAAPFAPQQPAQAAPAPAAPFGDAPAFDGGNGDSDLPF